MMRVCGCFVSSYFYSPPVDRGRVLSLKKFKFVPWRNELATVLLYATARDGLLHMPVLRTRSGFAKRNWRSISIIRSLRALIAFLFSKQRCVCDHDNFFTSASWEVPLKATYQLTPNHWIQMICYQDCSQSGQPFFWFLLCVRTSPALPYMIANCFGIDREDGLLDLRPRFECV